MSRYPAERLPGTSSIMLGRIDIQLDNQTVKLSSLTQAAACSMSACAPGEHRQPHETVGNLTLGGELRRYLTAMRSGLAR